MQLRQIGKAIVDVDQVRAILPGGDGKSVTIVFIDNERLVICSDNPQATMESLVPTAMRRTVSTF
jgi:hypothetical protein